MDGYLFLDYVRAAMDNNDDADDEPKEMATVDEIKGMFS